MSPTRLLPAALLAIVIPLAGCAAGQNDTTSHERTSPYTADVNLGPLSIRNVVVIPASQSLGTATPTPTPSDTSSATPSASPTGSASASASASASSSPTASASSAAPVAGYLSLVVASSTTDALINATVGGTSVSPSSGADFTVHPQRLLMIEAPQSGGATGGPSLTINGTQQLKVGTTIPVTLTFRDAGQVTVQAPIRDPYVA